MGVADTPLFKAQTFEFKEGISYIYGLNRSTALKTKNANFVGKSRFFGYLSEVLYDQPVVGLKQDKQKVGKRFVEFEVDGQLVKVMSSFSTRGKEKITVWVDGTQQSYLTPSKGKAAIAEVFRPSIDDFNSYVYLDSRVPHPLVRGTSQERKRFFTSFFGLNRIDAERKLFNAELARVLQAKKAYAELRKVYEGLRADVLSKADVEALRERYTELKTKLKRLSAKAERAQQVRRLYDFKQSMKDQIEKLTSMCGGEITQATFDETVKDAKWHLRNDEEGLADALAWEAYKEERAAYEDAVKDIEGSLDPARHRKGYQRYREAKKALDRNKSKLEELDEDLERPRKVTKCEGDVESLLGRRSSLRDKLGHATKFGGGVCPECGQKVKVSNPEEIERRLAEVQEQINSVQAYEAYRREYAQWKAQQERKASIEAKVAEARAQVKKYKPAYEAYLTLRDLVKPEPFKGKKLESSVKKRMLAESQEKIRVLEFCKSILPSILELAAVSPEDWALRKFDFSRVQPLQEEMATIRAKLEVHAAVRSKARDTKAQLDVLATEVEAEPALRLLLKGYADKAMKKMAIEAICARLMTLINHHARPYFPGFTFEFVWNTQLSIIAHRPNGEFSDVRKLSGAECPLFTLVLIQALNAFVPTRKKVSTLILDEPTSAFSEETTRIFHEMLPELNKTFPSIVVITPKTNERYPGAHNYTVVRTKAGATIQEGIIER